MSYRRLQGRSLVERLIKFGFAMLGQESKPIFYSIFFCVCSAILKSKKKTTKKNGSGFVENRIL